MVGPPKLLSDLHRIEAAVRIRCGRCGVTKDRALDDLIAEVRERGGTTVWPHFLAGMRCSDPNCQSAQLSALPLPFTSGQRRPRRFAPVVINLALKILREAAGRGRGEPRATLDVRLALHVLRPFTGRKMILTEFWEAAAAQPEHPWSGCHQPYRWLVNDLVEAGHEVWTDNRP